jgi:hypothetical protein
MAKGKKLNLLELISKREGKYMGFGINHENKEFKATLEIKSVVNNKGASFRYKAIGTDGNELNKDTHLFNKETILYNEEYTIICYNNKNELTLWTLNNNIGTMARFDLRRFRQVSSKHCLFIFGYGNPEDNTIFREEITIELWDNGDVSYNYSWGEAGGHFLSRSAVRMKKID